MANHYDVIVVGAGISGINSAYFLQQKCPKLSWTILEGRNELGGTWSLFKYPGIRADTDLRTYGFSWEPWESPNPIATGEAITDYLRQTVEKHGIDKKIQYGHFVHSLSWSSKDSTWTFSVTCDGSTMEYVSKYVVLGTGYYNYEQPLKATIPGIEKFQGQVIHPQFWPEDLDYTDKKVIIIGSGATTATLLPAMAPKAGRVTQVQRSPSYFFIAPESDPLDAFFVKYAPKSLQASFIRFKYIFFSILLAFLCRLFPDRMRKLLRGPVEKELPKNIDFDSHFRPVYNPGQQRVCLVPQGDYFQALRSGKADIKTGSIKTVTADGLTMDNGDHIAADIIITATGLQLAVGGGAKIIVDGKQVDPGTHFLWKNAMVSGVPNLWYVFGYVDASWTLATDTTARLFCRMINNMESRGQHSAVPTLTAAEERQMDQDNVPLLPYTSGYITTATDRRMMPRVGKSGNWQRRTNYFLDTWRNMFGNITDDIVYR